MAEAGEKVRVLLADDHRLFREALRLVLAPECEVVGEAASGEEALALAARTRPQVVLMDIEMPGIGGLAAVHRMAKLTAPPKVLLLSAHDDEEYVVEALGEAGAAGYLVKSDAAAELLDAVRAVQSGRRYVSPSIAPIVLRRMRRPLDSDSTPGPHLTRREREVLRLIGEGATSKEIAARLAISPKTAQVHRENLKQKLGVHSTAAMVRYAIKHKIVRID